MRRPRPQPLLRRQLDGLWHDLRFAGRALRRDPRFAASAILPLALGIAAATAVYSVAYGILFRPVPVHEEGSLVVVYAGDPIRSDAPISYPRLQAWDAGGIFDGLTSVSTRAFDLVIDGLAERIPAAAVTGDFFGVLGVDAVHGRVLIPGEGRAGAHAPAVISHGLWMRRFGADPGVLGRAIHTGSYQLTIVGVAPPGFERWRGEAHVWVPAESVTTPAVLTSNGYRLATPIARLRPDVSAATTHERLTALDGAFQVESDDTRGYVSRLVPLRDDVVPDALEAAVLVAIAAAGLTWLVACANLANLLLARGMRRRSDLAIRLAVGADRWRIVRQLLVESLGLALPAGVLGLLLATWGIQLLAAFGPPGVAGNDAVRVDLPVLTAGSLLMLLGAAISGAGPALRLSRVSLHPLLGERAAPRRLSNALLVAQVAVAVLILVGAALLVKSAVRMTQVDLGFDPQNALTVQFAFPQKFPNARAQDSERNWRLAAQDAILARLTALPGVADATLASTVFRPAAEYRSSIFLDDGRRFLNGEPQQRPFAPRQHRVGPGYFRVLGTPVIEGREFTEQDTPDSPHVAIMNETMAGMLWPGGSPIGARVNFGSYSPRRGYSEPWHEIVGVVRDIRYGDVSAPILPEIYRAASQQPLPGGYAIVRTAMAPEALAGSVRDSIRGVSGEIPVYAARTLAELVDESTAMTRYNAGLLLLCAVVTSLLCGFGLYSLLAYAIAARRRELGIRLAIGAPPRTLAVSVLRQAAWTLIPGLALGALLAWGAARGLASVLFGVSPYDPAAFASAAVGVALLGAAAAWMPARRAGRIDPVEVLKT